MEVYSDGLFNRVEFFFDELGSLGFEDVVVEMRTVFVVWSFYFGGGEKEKFVNE